MSQVLFEWGPWEHFLELCGGAPPIPVLAPVWPVTSLRLALRLHHEVPGIVVPESFLERLEAAGGDAAKVGWDRAAKLLHEAPEHGAAGVYLIAPFKNPDEVLKLL
jgi:5,10-methylenetetrahydrofolate reductase